MELAEMYIEHVNRWKSAPIDTVADLEQRLYNFRILFAYHSGVIENPEISYHNTREIFENGKVIDFTGDIRTVFEMQNQKDCYDYLRDKIIEKAPLDINLIKEVHKLLAKGTYDERRYQKGERPGQFKKHDYIVGDNIGVEPEYVEEELSILCDELNRYGSKNVLRAAAFFHVQFESIHPFADGNGRVGRTLMNYYLMTHDYPPVIIYDEDKSAYYGALAAYDNEDTIDPMIEFLQIETVKTWSVQRTAHRNLFDQMEEPGYEAEMD